MTGKPCLLSEGRRVKDHQVCRRETHGEAFDRCSYASGALEDTVIPRSRRKVPPAVLICSSGPYQRAKWVGAGKLAKVPSQIFNLTWCKNFAFHCGAQAEPMQASGCSKTANRPNNPSQGTYGYWAHISPAWMCSPIPSRDVPCLVDMVHCPNKCASYQPPLPTDQPSAGQVENQM